MTRRGNLSAVPARRKKPPVVVEESPAVVVTEKARISLPIFNTLAIAAGAASFVFTAGIMYSNQKTTESDVAEVQVHLADMSRTQRGNSMKIHDMCRAVETIQRYTVPANARHPVTCDFAE